MKPEHKLNEMGSFDVLYPSPSGNSHCHEDSNARAAPTCKGNEYNQLINKRMIIFSHINTSHDLELILSHKIGGIENISHKTNKTEQTNEYASNSATTKDTHQFISDNIVSNNPIHIAQLTGKNLKIPNQIAQLNPPNQNAKYEKSEEHKPRSWASMFLQKLDKDANVKADDFTKIFALPKQKLKSIIQQLRDSPQNYKDTLIINECTREQIISESLKSNALIKWDLVENPAHSDYMLNFKVKRCIITHKNSTEIPDCFGYHSATEIRRIPMYFQNRNDVLHVAFNYMPFLCSHKLKCKKISTCLYAHNQYEIDYHPLMYKTRLCRYMRSVEDECECKNTGKKCPYAHSERDIRNLLRLLRENVLSICSILNPVEEIKVDTFDVSVFKIDKCQEDACSNTKCISYHNKLERRRVGVYKPIPCKSVYFDKCFHEPSVCAKNDNCDYCHTKNELYYHPDNYKKSVCNRPTPCKYAEQCPDIHENTQKCSKCNEEISCGLKCIVFECLHVVCTKCNKCQQNELCVVCGKKFTRILIIPVNEENHRIKNPMGTF